MNVSSTRLQTQLWWVRTIDNELRVGPGRGHLFAGDEEAMGRHINELHLNSGVSYVAQQVEAGVKSPSMADCSAGQSLQPSPATDAPPSLVEETVM